MASTHVKILEVFPFQEQIGLSRSVAFATFEDLAQREVWHRPQDDMDVVGHDNPIIQQILFVVKMPERLGDHVRDFRPAQMTFAHAAVEVTLHLAAQFAMDFPGLLGACIGRESAQSFSVFALEAQEHLLRKRIREPKRDEV
jgi:hypothetical protein